MCLSGMYSSCLGPGRGRERRSVGGLGAAGAMKALQVLGAGGCCGGWCSE